MYRRHAIDLVAAAAELLEAWGRPGRARVRIGSTPTLDLAAEIAQSAQGGVLVIRRATHTPQPKMQSDTWPAKASLRDSDKDVISAGGSADGYWNALACGRGGGVVAHRE